MAALRDLHVSARRVLPASLLSVRFARGGGPGGQNVNKVETKVDLRLDLAGAEAVLGADAVARVRMRLTTRLDGDGNLQVVSSEHRQQAQNLEAALVRMEILLRSALAIARARRPTRPTAASRRKRVENKRQRGEVKRKRGSPREGD